MNELQLRQLFKNLSDCYADTWHSERGLMEEGEVIQAMTEDRFIEALKEIKILPIPVAVKSLPTDECVEQWWAEGKESDKFWQDAPYRTNGDVVEEIKTALKYFITVWQ
jgi:hypothetical protein